MHFYYNKITEVNDVSKHSNYQDHYYLQIWNGEDTGFDVKVDTTILSTLWLNVQYWNIQNTNELETSKFQLFFSNGPERKQCLRLK